MISIELLGGACLRSGDAVLAGPPAQRHRVALLALAVDAWPQPLSRDRAIALLWPERDDAAARRLLNLSVHVLRNALGEGVLRSVGDGLVFDPAGNRCDLLELRDAIRAGDSAEVVRLWPGSLLEGFHLAESAEFMQWLDARRNELAAAHARALVATAEAAARRGDAHAAVAACRRLVAADPHSGEHARRLMRALDAAGDRPAAIRHAAEHARRLHDDLELPPDPAVQALAEELRRAPAAQAALPSVAVLPFINLGGGSEHEYFADGITEDVIAHLSKIRALKVIARASVMPFKSRERSIREIASALGVRTVLDGSVRHSGNRVRVVAALVDAESGGSLWTETYDREITDIFAIQTDLALRIAAALRAELSPEERGRVLARPTEDIHAYRLFIQGRRRFLEFTAEDLARAEVFLKAAVERDPSFALAYSQLAMTYVELAEHGARPAPGLYAQAKAAVARALELAPDLSEAHATAGYLKMVADYDWPGAEAGLRRALELSPNSGYAVDLLARLCWAVGRFDEGITLGRRAQELDPAANRIDMSTMLLRAGRYDEALVAVRYAVEVEPSSPRARATLGWACFLSGDRERGLAELECAVACSNRSALWLAQYGEALAMAGRAEEARSVLRELEERSTREFISPYH
ncbi:MAG TPA: BTAD domain-containing putative transcriptional regulator, partial [Gemmatimonadales bacterium]|nr:BTAD domain-containing putative transcriptional regulator [Gemmatimonadales bacterium]